MEGERIYTNVIRDVGLSCQEPVYLRLEYVSKYSLVILVSLSRYGLENTFLHNMAEN